MAEEKDSLFEKAKVAVRSTVVDDELDTELNDLILAARADLKIVGLVDKADSNDNALITQAVLLYVKANWGYDNPDAERFGALYQQLKDKLSVSTQYLQGADYEVG